MNFSNVPRTTHVHHHQQQTQAQQPHYYGTPFTSTQQQQQQQRQPQQMWSQSSQQYSYAYQQPQQQMYGQQHQQPLQTQQPSIQTRTPSKVPSTTAGGWPVSLQGYVEKALSVCKTQADRQFTEKYMNETINKAKRDQTLWEIDWSKVPLPPIPSSQTAEAQQQVSATVSTSGTMQRQLQTTPSGSAVPSATIDRRYSYQQQQPQPQQMPAQVSSVPKSPISVKKRQRQEFLQQRADVAKTATGQNGGSRTKKSKRYVPPPPPLPHQY